MKSLSDHMIPSRTGRATCSDDNHHYRAYQTKVRWTLFFILVAMISFAFLWHFVKRSYGSEPERGEITINTNGDIITWTPEAAKVTGVKDMTNGDLFSLLPSQRQDSARVHFHLAMRGSPYKPFETFYRVDDGYVDLKFGKCVDDVCVVQLSRMR